MNVQHFLRHNFLKKNKKGGYREIRIGPPKVRHEYQSGGSRENHSRVSIACRHCKAPVAVVRDIKVVAATCSNCITRERLSLVQVG